MLSAVGAEQGSSRGHASHALGHTCKEVARDRCECRVCSPPRRPPVRLLRFTLACNGFNSAYRFREWRCWSSASAICGLPSEGPKFRRSALRLPKAHRLTAGLLPKRRELPNGVSANDNGREDPAFVVSLCARVANSANYQIPSTSAVFEDSMRTCCARPVPRVLPYPRVKTLS